MMLLIRARISFSKHLDNRVQMDNSHLDNSHFAILRMGTIVIVLKQVGTTALVNERLTMQVKMCMH